MRHKRDTRALLTLGWREWLALPGLGIPAIRAKIDTGARSSALHVDSLQSFEREGIEWVRFSLHPRADSDAEQSCEAVLIDRRPVTDSGGRRTDRVFIRTPVVLGPLRFEVEMNLTSRHNMLFPMLLGRTAMSSRCLVDPSASFLLGELQDDQDELIS